MTVIFVSHDMNAVREYCDRAVLIEKSEIIRSGNVAYVASAYTKMFIGGNDDGSTEQRIARKRWGNDDLKYDDVSSRRKTYTESDQNIEIEALFSANNKVDNPVFGFTIKNGVGTEMLGSNTVLSHYDTSTYKKGDKVHIKWTVPNILNDGDYSIDVTIINRDTLSEYDWWEDATSFSVVRTEHTSFVVEPKAIFTEKNVKDK
jgi:ABC-type methionine transport system ATPase subunit